MNNMIYLKKLSMNDGKDVYEMLNRIGVSENEFTNPVNGMSYSNYVKWLEEQEQWSKGNNLPNGYVIQNIYWLYDDQIIVGIGKIRHSLTPQSRIKGGNIGYAIDPIHRGKKYGIKLLKLLLEKCDELNVVERIATVEKYNYASKKCCESNGGILYDENQYRWFFKFN